VGKNIVIVGGGIGGLAAGCYFQMNGYSTHVLEMGQTCGGLCTSWKRKGYVFDGATNWLAGSAPSINLHHLLAEIIDFSKLDISYDDVFIRVEHGGDHLNVYKNADRLRDEMLRIAPEDRSAIITFTDAIRTVRRFRIPYQKPREVFGVLDYLRFPVENLPLLLFLAKWRRISIGEFARRFTNEKLRTMFLLIFPNHEFFAMFSVIMTLGWMNAGSDGYPRGGSARFTEVVEDRYKKLGGIVSLGKRVTSVAVEGGRAKGVVCSDGSRFDADVVVSAVDGYETVFGLLGGRHLDRGIIRRFGSWRTFPAIVQVSLGVARTFDETIHKFNIELLNPICMGEYVAKDMMVRVCNFDPSLAPPNKTAVIVQIRTHDYQYWVDMRARSPQKYARAKEDIAQAVVESLEKRFGGIDGNIEACDVATPATFIRYTNIWKGSYQGWAPTPQAVGRMLKKTLPNLGDFYLAGQWLWPAGGLTGVIRLARDVAYIICCKDGRQFTIV